MTNLDSILKSRDITLPTKVHLVKVWMWELDYKESWALKNWCFWTVVLDKTLKSPLDCKETHPVHPKGDQSWVFSERTDVEAKLQYCGHLMQRWPHGKRSGGWERLKARGEGDDIGWDSWMASPTRWRWVWVNSGSWWWTGRPGVLQSMGLQRVGHNWTKLNWTGGSLEALLFSDLLGCRVKLSPVMQSPEESSEEAESGCTPRQHCPCMWW